LEALVFTNDVSDQVKALWVDIKDMLNDEDMDEGY
jgi:hypothetical protein